MAYNNFYPYQPLYTPTYQTPVQQPVQQTAQAINQTNNSTNNFAWVQGENGAKSYMVGAGNSVILLDSEDSVFYIKSADTSGMPLPLRIFDYTERNAQTVSQPAQGDFTDELKNYVTKDEFKAELARIKSEDKKTTTRKVDKDE